MSTNIFIILLEILPDSIPIYHHLMESAVGRAVGPFGEMVCLKLLPQLV